MLFSSDLVLKSRLELGLGSVGTLRPFGETHVTVGAGSPPAMQTNESPSSSKVVLKMVGALHYSSSLRYILFIRCNIYLIVFMLLNTRV